MGKKAKLAIIGIVVVALLSMIAVIAVKIIKNNAAGTERMSLTDYMQVPEGEMLLLLDDQIYGTNCLYSDGKIYLDLALVMRMNKRFYWDAEKSILLYTTATELLRVQGTDSFYHTNKTKVSTDYPILQIQGEQVYVALDYVEPYLDIAYQVYTEPDRIMLQYRWGDYLYADIMKDTQLRVDNHNKSEILADLKQGERVMFVDAGGIQANGYVKVMTSDGVRGYVREKCISESYYSAVRSEKTFAEYPHITKEHSVNLVWHMTVNTDANQYFTDLYAPTKGITAVAPTWFNVNSEKGTLDCRADADYVVKAHELGLEVWGMFSNFHPNSSEAVEFSCLELLSDSANRENLVNEIISNAIKYDLDGVNIDFETLKTEEGPHFIQFLRELSIKCRNNGLILSVDNYIPANYNAFYDLEEQGKLVDYVVIMGYDEHYEGSPEAGSVSSLGFVSDATANTLAKVPAEQVIMAIPFYTRLWKETKAADGTVSLSSEALGMEAADQWLRTNEVTTTWQSEAGQFYGEHETGTMTYKIWLEEELSIEEKMKVISNAGLAGVAEWRLGFEKSSVWNVIQRYLH